MRLPYARTQLGGTKHGETKSLHLSLTVSGWLAAFALHSRSIHFRDQVAWMTMSHANSHATSDARYTSATGHIVQRSNPFSGGNFVNRDNPDSAQNVRALADSALCLRQTDRKAGTVTFAYCLLNFALQSRGALEDLLRAAFLTDSIVVYIRCPTGMPMTCHKALTQVKSHLRIRAETDSIVVYILYRIHALLYTYCSTNIAQSSNTSKRSAHACRFRSV